MIRLLSSSDEPSAVARRFFVSASIGFAVTLGTALVFLPVAFTLSRNATRAGIVAFSYVLLVVTVGLAALRLRSSLQPAEFRKVCVSSLEPMGGVALWTVPSVILLVRSGLLGLLLFGAFTAAIGRLLKQAWSGELQGRARTVPVLALEFTPDSDFVDAHGSTARLVRLTGLVCLAYAGIAAELVGSKTLAIVCMAASCFISAWILHDSREEERTSGRNSARKLLIQATFAIGASFLLLLAFSRHSGSGPIGTGASGRQNFDSSNHGHYSSVILFNKKRVVSVVVPPEKASHAGPVRTLSRSMTIPFSGEYWFFRWPLLRPLPTSVKTQGNPTIFSVTVRGFGALQMQARQSLGQRISMRCCRAIKVVLRVADEQPDSVQMELILIDSSRRGHNSQTLGERSLAEPSMSLPDPQVQLSSETFQFEMPLHSQIESFNYLEVWFHLGPPRAGQSAVVSIQQFELIP
ncbi:MAG: hypothetical protein WAM39_10810 [Bryobacteraceae bacterium]